jgi:hypothetical protein
MAGLDRYAPNRHDTESITARSLDEVAPTRDTISHYAPVLIASLSIGIRRAGVQKKIWSARWHAGCPMEKFARLQRIILDSGRTRPSCVSQAPQLKREWSLWPEIS